MKPENNKEENQNLISMLDTINDGYIDPFDWTTRLLDILRIQFKNEDEEAVENLVKAKQFSSQRLLVSSSSKNKSDFISFQIFLVPLHTILFLSYYVQINCYVYLGIHSAQTLIIFLSFNAKALRKKLTRKIKFDMWLYIFALGCSVCWYITFFMDSCICTEYIKSKRSVFFKRHASFRLPVWSSSLVNWRPFKGNVRAAYAFATYLQRLVVRKGLFYDFILIQYSGRPFCRRYGSPVLLCTGWLRILCRH